MWNKIENGIKKQKSGKMYIMLHMGSKLGYLFEAS